MQVGGRRQQALGYVHGKSDSSAPPLEMVGHLGVQLHSVFPISPHTYRAASSTSHRGKICSGFYLDINTNSSMLRQTSNTFVSGLNGQNRDASHL